MKIKEAKEGKKEYRTLTLRIGQNTMLKLDRAVKAYQGKRHLSRQRLVEAILDQVLEDSNFTLHIDWNKK